MTLIPLHDLNRLGRRTRLPEDEYRASMALRDGDGRPDMFSLDGLSLFGLARTRFPEHADILLVTAPIRTTRTLLTCLDILDAMPTTPRLLVVLAGCQPPPEPFATDPVLATRSRRAFLDVAVTVPVRVASTDHIIDSLREPLERSRRVAPSALPGNLEHSL